MKKRSLINEENGFDMQHWYIEKLGHAVRHAAELKDHIISLGNLTRFITIPASPYEHYGMYCKIKEEFDELVRYLLRAYEFSCGCDKCDESLIMLKLLKEHEFDPEAVFEEDERMHREALDSLSNEQYKKEEELLFGKKESDRTERIKAEQAKYPNVPVQIIENIVDTEILVENETEAKKIEQDIVDAMPDDPDQLRNIIAIAEVKLEQLGESVEE